MANNQTPMNRNGSVDPDRYKQSYNWLKLFKEILSS
jgi:hypothetical protein